MIAGIIGAVLILVIAFLVLLVIVLLIDNAALRAWAEDKIGEPPYGDEKDKYLKYAISKVIPFMEED